MRRQLRRAKASLGELGEPVERKTLSDTDGTVSATALSGAAFIGATGSIVGGSLETSNTNITDQFTAMIQTQQAYSANTNVINVSNQMLQTATNMVV